MNAPASTQYGSLIARTRGNTLRLSLNMTRPDGSNEQASRTIALKGGQPVEAAVGEALGLFAKAFAQHLVQQLGPGETQGMNPPQTTT